jgi:hypothetical protein
MMRMPIIALFAIGRNANQQRAITVFISMVPGLLRRRGWRLGRWCHVLLPRELGAVHDNMHTLYLRPDEREYAWVYATPRRDAIAGVDLVTVCIPKD